MKTRNDPLNAICRQMDALEDALENMRILQEKGGRLRSSVVEAQAELDWLTDSLRGDGALMADSAFHREATLKCQELSARLEAISDKVRPEGFSLASDRALPELFGRLAGRYPRFWKLYERLTTVSGIICIFFVLALITCFCVTGWLPFKSFAGSMASGTKGIVFALGMLMGLCLHEFSHGIVLANNKIAIDRVGVMAGFIAGGFVEAEEHSFARAEPDALLRFNAAGIGCNAFTALCLGVAGVLCSSDILVFLALGNLSFGFIKSLPVAPLDGGWVYEDLVKRHLRNNTVKNAFLSGRIVLFALWLILLTRLFLQHP